MPESERVESDFLRVRAWDSGVTYIGGEFCNTPGGEKMRAIFESGRADVALDINAARRLVQAGINPTDAMLENGLHVGMNGRKDFIPIIEDCLGKIAAGECRVYPV